MVDSFTTAGDALPLADAIPRTGNECETMVILVLRETHGVKSV